MAMASTGAVRTAEISSWWRRDWTSASSLEEFASASEASRETFGGSGIRAV